MMVYERRSLTLKSRKRWIAVFLLVCASHTLKAEEVNEIMRDASDTMLRMLPSLYSESPDRLLVMENLIRLDYLFKQTESHFKSEQEGSQVNYILLRQRLGDAIELGERRNINFLSDAVVEAFALCASCHTQDSRMKPAFGVSKIKALDEYLAAEFSYLTRDYEAALTSFSNYLESDERTLQRDGDTFDRVLVITAGVMADPKFASDTLSSMRTHLDKESVLYEHVGEWIGVLEGFAKEPDAISFPLSKESVRALDEYLDNDWPVIQWTLTWAEQEAWWVVIRSSLNKFLVRGAKESEVPKLLYWLAVSDRALHYRFYSSLSKAYLEQCIERHPQDTYARRCLQEYEMLVLVSFSGSGGTHVPVEVQERLTELRRLVYSGQNRNYRSTN